MGDRLLVDNITHQIIHQHQRLNVLNILHIIYGKVDNRFRNRVFAIEINSVLRTMDY